MTTWPLVLQALAAALWFGGGLSTLLSTRALFAAVPVRSEAGSLAGAVLASYRRLQMAAAALALVSLSPLFRWPILFAALATVVQLGVDAAARRIRADAGGTLESLPPEDPRRARFAQLHGVALLLLAAQVFFAGWVLCVADPHWLVVRRNPLEW